MPSPPSPGPLPLRSAKRMSVLTPAGAQHAAGLEQFSEPELTTALSSGPVRDQLAQLDREYQEGEITQKGYDKRRSRILSTFISRSRSGSEASRDWAAPELRPAAANPYAIPSVGAGVTGIGVTTKTPDSYAAYAAYEPGHAYSEQDQYRPEHYQQEQHPPVDPYPSHEQQQQQHLHSDHYSQPYPLQEQYSPPQEQQTQRHSPQSPQLGSPQAESQGQYYDQAYPMPAQYGYPPPEQQPPNDYFPQFNSFGNDPATEDEWRRQQQQQQQQQQDGLSHAHASDSDQASESQQQEPTEPQGQQESVPQVRLPSFDGQQSNAQFENPPQEVFSDFTSQPGVDDAYETEREAGAKYDNLKPTDDQAQVQEQDYYYEYPVLLPLEPRAVPFSVHDPHDPKIEMSAFDSIGAVLRHRARTIGKSPAFTVLDIKGKETASLTWEKAWSRAEKIAQLMRDKSNLYRGDRVALVYREVEMTDFAVALLGCFLAGVVGVAVRYLDDHGQMAGILESTGAHLALTTESTMKVLTRDISRRVRWIDRVEWWKTTDFGGFHSKGGLPAVGSQTVAAGADTGTADLAYIDFARAPTGDVRGVVLSHRTIMHQMAVLQAIVQTVPEPTETGIGPDGKPMRATTVESDGAGETIVSYLDPRVGIGLVLGILFAVYGGHHSIWLPPATVDTPGQYAHCLSKLRSTLVVADYPGLKRPVYNYQQDPKATLSFKKGYDPYLHNIKMCLIDTLAVDPEFDLLLADRWLRPLRSQRARAAVAPMLTLPEHGGMIISVRDWLGGEERMGCSIEVEEEEPADVPVRDFGGTSTLLGGGVGVGQRQQPKGMKMAELLIERDALTYNELKIVASGDEVAKRLEEGGIPTVRVGAFGYPIPDGTLALVDPETCQLCGPGTIGEIWVDSPSLSGGFWALPRHTDAIFHSRPMDPRTGIPLDMEFLRTGLLGFVLNGKVYVLGLYEDRIRQRDDLIGLGPTALTMPVVEGLPRHRFFFVQHLVTTIIKHVHRVYDCSAFDTEVNGQYLPVVLLETQAASTAPTTAGGPPRQLDVAYLETLAEQVMTLLAEEHDLRVYCVMITAPNKLPRMIKNGHRTIGNMLCRREFESGNLACVHVKFAVDQSVGPVPAWVDPAGIWGPVAVAHRQQVLGNAIAQFSGADFTPLGIDEPSGRGMAEFGSVIELLQNRAQRIPDKLAYCPIDGRGKEGKPISWRKLDQKVASVVALLRSKIKPALRPGEPVLLMYTHSVEFVYALYACLIIGVTAIPVGPVDYQRLAEDGPALLYLVADWKIRMMLVNAPVESLLKVKSVSQHLKRTAAVMGIEMPSTFSTSKVSKSSGTVASGLRVPTGVNTALVWVHWTPDQRRVAVELTHSSLLSMCRVVKETCRMPFGRPLLGCVRSTAGLGFIHSWLLGPYLAAPTYIISPMDFAQNPLVVLHTLSRYRVRDTYATAHMLDHIVNTIRAAPPGAPGPPPLPDLRNVMVLLDGRAPASVLPKAAAALSLSSLPLSALAPVYAHPLDPVITARSYMGVGAVELCLDRASLRRGLVAVVEPDSSAAARALKLTDAGIVAAATQICILNPDSGRLCRTGEFGEIWVAGPGSAAGFYRSQDALDMGRVGVRLHPLDGHAVADRDHSTFIRTGDLGFLHPISRIGPDGSPVGMQLLFVLGQIGETFDVHGLQHFPNDIEASVESCHPNIAAGGAAVFQAGGLVVVLVEVSRRNYLAGIVPVVVNTVLNEHQFVVDVVAFVGPGDFPRSRLGDKQRGKILAGWVSGKRLPIIAQFAIGFATDLDGRPGGLAAVSAAAAAAAAAAAGTGTTTFTTSTGTATFTTAATPTSTSTSAAGAGGASAANSSLDPYAGHYYHHHGRAGSFAHSDAARLPGSRVSSVGAPALPDGPGRPASVVAATAAAGPHAHKVTGSGELMRDLPEPRERFARLDLNL